MHGPEQVEAMHGEINDGSRKPRNEMRCKEMKRRRGRMEKKKEKKKGKEGGRKDGGGGVGS